MSDKALPPPLGTTANPAPARQANSVRRTSTIDVHWPGGLGGDRLFVGRVRDYRTLTAEKEGIVLAEAEMRASVDDGRVITAIAADPAPPRLQELVGVRGGGHLRMFAREIMPQLLEEAAPLYLALDDISGTSLISPWAWSHWVDNWLAEVRGVTSPEQERALMAERADVCWGLQTGNSGLSPGSARDAVGKADAGELRNPVDSAGWHAFPIFQGPSFRRARRIDVTLDDAAGVVRVTSAFQDSALLPGGGRAGLHEYDLSATVDIATGKLLTLLPEGRILPFSECPGAVQNTQRLLGTPIGEIRETVLAELRGPAGCTHLNDALRALAEVPRLAGYLAALQPA